MGKEFRCMCKGLLGKVLEINWNIYFELKFWFLLFKKKLEMF